NLAVVWLLLGKFAEGWPEYEWRWRCKRFAVAARPFRQPLWDGSRLDGRTILVHTEQGYGDILQFVRYAALVKQRGGTVLLASPAALPPLLASCAGLDRLLPQGMPLPAFDVHAPLLSLPGILRTTLDTIPHSVPYLSAESARVEHWRRELSALPGFKVGINWRGNPKNPYDRYRSMRLEQLALLATVPGVQLVSLQK